MISGTESVLVEVCGALAL